MKRHLLHSLRSVVRAPWKALVFFVLIACVTAILFLGLGAYAAGNIAIAEGDANYVTIADFQFIGDNYPDASVADEEIADAIAAFPWEEVRLAPGIVSVAPALRMTGLPQGYTIPNQWSVSPYRDHVILILYCVMPSYSYGTELWGFSVERAMYPLDFPMDENREFIFFPEPDPEHPLFARARTYAIVGNTSWVGNRKSILFTDLQPICETIGIDSIESVLDITDNKTEFLEHLPPDYEMLVDFLLRENAGLNVIVTNNLDALPEFHQNQILGNSEGRCRFTAEEVADAAKLCVITRNIANATGLGIGDTLALRLCNPSTSLTGTAQSSESEDAVFAIIGIVEPSEQAMWGNVYVPGTAESYALARANSFSLGQVVLKNGQAETFSAYATPLLPARVRMNIYDQGYASAEKAFLSAIQTGAILALGSLAAFLIVLAVFGFLFAFRQRESADTMLTLGAKSLWVRAYLCFGAGILAALAAAAGAVAGYLLSGRLNETLFTRAVNPWDSKYSDSALGMQKDFLQSIPKVPAYLFLLVIFGAVLCAVLFLLFFSQRAISVRSVAYGRTGMKKTKRRASGYVPKKERKSRAARGGALKYAWLSMTRGGTSRFLVSFGACLVLAVFVCAVNTSAVRFAQQQEALYDNTLIEGAFTNFFGNSVTNLNVAADAVQLLRESPYVQDVYTATRGHPAYPLLRAKDYEYYYKELSNIYAREGFDYEASRWPKLILTDKLRIAPEFAYGSGEVNITWAEGWDETRFAAQTADDQRVCIVPESWMQGKVMAELDAYYAKASGEALEPLIVETEAGGHEVHEWYEYEDENGDLQYPIVLYREGRSVYVKVNGEELEPLTRMRDDGIEEMVFYYLYEDENGNMVWPTREFRPIAPVPVELGSFIILGVYPNYNDRLQEYAEIVGCFASAGARENFYCPAGQTFTQTLWYSRWTPAFGYESWTETRDIAETRSAAAFTLQNARDVDAFKAFLAENHFGYPGSYGRRGFVYLRDRAFLEARSSLARQRSYLENISVLLYGLSVAVSVFLAYLLISGRRTELALMKSVGTGGLRIFLSFFFEQLMLALLAGGAGLLLSFAVWQGLPLQGMLGIGIVCACYVLGCAVSIAAQCRVSVRALFTDE